MPKNTKIGELKFNFEENVNLIKMKWLGVSNDMNTSEVPINYLKTLSTELKGKKLIVDFGSLEYMNSSATQLIILFFSELNNNEIETQILYNEDLEWQSLLFSAIKISTKFFKYISFKE